jgi:hypothetical protein
MDENSLVNLEGFLEILEITIGLGNKIKRSSSVSQLAI